MRKTAYMTSGIGLIVLGVLIAPLPGPMGIPVMMIGAVVLLRASPGMRRRWVQARKRWPRAMRPFDSALTRLRGKHHRTHSARGR